MLNRKFTAEQGATGVEESLEVGHKPQKVKYHWAKRNQNPITNLESLPPIFKVNNKQKRKFGVGFLIFLVFLFERNVTSACLY